MAAIPYESILSSDFFKFLVGCDKRQFLIHSAVVACQSQALDKLINGDLREASERCVRWPDVDPETFVRFSQYAYTGDYLTAPPRTREQTSPKEFPPPPDSPPKFTRSRKKKSSLSWGEGSALFKDKDLWSQFKKLYPGVDLDREPEANSPEDDFSDVLLSHARLYIFADCYGISTLKLLCLRKLRQTLERFTVYEEAIDDIVQLVHFCYENTIECDEMRDLVNMYTACKVVELWRSEEFQRLTVETGEYVRGLISEMLKRVD
ncbi:hypothetical protein B0T10DRAFT_584842 [Thelonectria olida]|uniref:BTB domain-containing protein n=1 Tax=Thelonectria olida TaxID=1576542 RepID=A0A9P8VW61_9HYPO|nr:hypothetical protein B0T10DRAFT_584842 [Thelonectria olida]